MITALVQRYLDERHLATGTRHIFRQCPTTSLLLPAAWCFPADSPTASWPLLSWVISVPSGPLSSCFASGTRGGSTGQHRLPAGGLLEEAHNRGQTLMNLGLGINDGVGFFKRKWGAVPFLPYVEVSWEVHRAGISKLPRLGRKGRVCQEAKPTGDQQFREPGIWETVREHLFGARRPLDCLQVEVTTRCPGRCLVAPIPRSRTLAFA